MHFFDISNIKIRIDGDVDVIIDELEKFSIKSSNDIALEVTFKQHDFIEVPKGEATVEHYVSSIKIPNGYCYYVIQKTNQDVLALMELDPKIEKATIHYRNKNSYKEGYNFEYEIGYYTKLLMGILFRFSILKHHGIVMHASTIEWQGKGIVFTAPSGTGKSTQVKLWQQHFGDSVNILNDDTPAIRFVEETPYVYGTPWSGSSNIHMNSSAPIAAIVILEQAKKNSIVRLTPQEAAIKLIPRVFLPYFDADMMNGAMNVFEKVISSVPVYFLSCRPDEEAVELVYKWVK